MSTKVQSCQGTFILIHRSIDFRLDQNFISIHFISGDYVQILMLFYSVIIIFQRQEEISEESMETMILTAIRNVIGCGRYAQKLRAKQNNSGGNAISTFTMIQDGTNCYVAGMGDIFQNFLFTKKLSGYLGEGQPILCVFDVNYEQSPCKVVRFDQTFKKLRDDISKCEFTTSEIAQKVCGKCSTFIPFR